MSAGQYGWARVFLGGNLTLATQTTFKLSTFSSTAKDTSGLGIAGSGGETEIYSDLKVWQLDALRQTPVIVNDKLYPLPSNTYVTGNMHGLEYAYTSASTITVQPGICMDSTNQVVLDKSIAQVVTIPSAINTVYNLFLCDDDTVRTDTDVDGANLSAYDIRWIGFVVTDGSGNLRTFVMSGDKYQSDDPSNSILQTLSTTRATLDISLLAPPSRVSGIEMGVYSPNSDNVQYTDDFYVGSGTTKIGRVGTNPAYGGNVWLSGGGEQDGSFIAWKTGGIEHQGSHNTNSLCLRAVKLRR